MCIRDSSYADGGQIRFSKHGVISSACIYNADGFLYCAANKATAEIESFSVGNDIRPLALLESSTHTTTEHVVIVEKPAAEVYHEEAQAAEEPNVTWDETTNFYVGVAVIR